MSSLSNRTRIWLPCRSSSPLRNLMFDKQYTCSIIRTLPGQKAALASYRLLRTRARERERALDAQVRKVPGHLSIGRERGLDHPVWISEKLLHSFAEMTRLPDSMLSDHGSAAVGALPVATSGRVGHSRADWFPTKWSPEPQTSPVAWGRRERQTHVSSEGVVEEIPTPVVALTAAP